MNTVIIHRHQRTDRIAAIAALLSHFPDAQILEAKVPAWEIDPHARAMRGCAVSHLSAVKAFLTRELPLLVLEDDALYLDTPFPDCSKAPSDAGIILLGADVDQYGDDYGSGFREVLPPFFGTHAVLYLPRLLESPYLLNAFERMATAPMGSGNGAVCTESLLLLAAQDSGLKIYRANKMVFSTVPSLSDSRGIVEVRNLSLEAGDRDGLLPFSTWDDVFLPWAGRKAHLLSVKGNTGDMLINAATRQLFNYHGITETSLEAADVLMYPGGGNIGGQYPFKDDYRAFESSKLPKIVLPQTLLHPDPYLDLATEVWVRDAESLRTYPSAKRAPDLALAYRPSLTASRSRDTGMFIREDAERTVVPTNNIGDPVRFAADHYQYLRLAGDFSSITTNRLHFAVAAMHMGVSVTLLPNSYHKNRSVWESDLERLGCKFSDH